MNRTGIACAVAVVALGAFVIGGAAYTGARLEDTLKAHIAQQNAALQQVLPGSQISLNSLQTGLFSSEARYDVTLDTPNDDQPAVRLIFSDHIEHGPLPMSRLSAFKWLPVMAVSHLTLEKTPDLQGWFDASGSTPPLTATTTINYSGNLFGTLQLSTLQLKKNEKNLNFSGLTAHYELAKQGSQATIEATSKQLDINDNNGQLVLNGVSLGLNSEGSQFEKINVNGRIDAISWKEKSDKQPVTLSINKTELVIQRARSASNIYVGDGRLSIGHISASTPEKPGLALSNIVFSDKMQEANQKLAGNIGYSLGEIKVSDKPLGSFNVSLGYGNLDIPHVRKIADVIDTQSKNATFNLTHQDKQTLSNALLGILDNKPQLSIDELLVKTANGQSRFDLQLNLQNPTQSTQAYKEVAFNAVNTLKSTLTISKPMIRDVVMWKALLEPETSPEVLNQEADQAIEMVSSFAAQTQLATVENDNIRSSLHYTQNEITLNGVKMPFVQFLEKIGVDRLFRN